MQLYIHFGLYKTGSSYLQTLCANSRSHLEKFGFFFPFSHKDEDMLAGKITPGNGGGITSMIKRGQVKKCTHLIKGWCKQAKAKNCDRIIISDEALIHGFANEKGLNCLNESIKLNNIESVSLFAFLRNPVEHCLSTYKHRAKKGGYPDFKGWVINHYETPLVFKSFLEIFEQYPYEWKFAKYNRNENVMANYFFNDWLKIPVPPSKSNGRINSSLTLAEIVFIQKSYLNDRKTVLPLYNEFIRIKQGLKAQNNSLDNYYSAVASNHLLNYADVFERLNLLIFNQEKIEIPKGILELNKLDLSTIAYSSTQLDGIVSAYKRSYKLSSILGFYKSRITTSIKRYVKSKF